MAMINPVAMMSKPNTSYKVISPPPFPFRIEGEEVAAVAFDDFLVDSIAIFACDDKRDKHPQRPVIVRPTHDRLGLTGF